MNELASPLRHSGDRMLVTAAARIALVSMPWAPITEPPLGLSILRACLSQAQICSRVFHFNLSLLKDLTYETYGQIADLYGINDFVFSGVLDATPVTAQRFNQLLRGIAQTKHNCDRQFELAEKILKIRDLIVPAYLEECMKVLISDSPTLVGFTCTFDQTFAAIALAKKLREKMPDVMIVLGGYAVNDETGEMVLGSFPFIDCIAQADSELSIVELAEASVGCRPLSGVSGIQYHSSRGSIRSTRILRAELDLVPIPDFDDYFADKSRLEEENQIRIRSDFLPVETSRGCWWGQKHHCVFCGIDEFTMKYRSRTVDSVIRMFDTLHKQYGMGCFRVNDYILPHSYHKTLIPKLASKPQLYSIACESKANLTPNQMQNLSLAGFREIQPGIESFSSHVLSLMKKGVSASQNVFLLTLGRRFRIVIHYNILYGIPGETIEDYRQMVQLIPALYHLDPPSSVTVALFTKYSPLQEGRVDGSSGSNTPAPSYDLVLSKEYLAVTGFDMSKYCYYFEGAYEPSDELKFWHYIVEIQCTHWANLYEGREVELWFKQTEEGIVFFDSRRHADGEWTAGNLDMRKLYFSLLEKPLLLERWHAKAADAGVCKNAAEEAFAILQERRIVVIVDGMVIALAQEVEDAA